MASRREFLQVGMAALALPISARAGLSPSAFAIGEEPAATPLYKVVFDERFPASVQFGREAKRMGAEVHGIKGDITDLWFHDLDLRWKKGPVAIAGLTGHGALFCLERLAWDHGMRVVYRGDHKFLPNGDVAHALTGHESTLRQAAGLDSDGPAWGVRIAEVVMHSPEGRFTPSKTTIIGASAGPSGHDETDLLISWVIAPVHSSVRSA